MEVQKYVNIGLQTNPCFDLSTSDDLCDPGSLDSCYRIELQNDT